MKKPQFPVISIYKKRGLDIIQSEYTREKATVLAVLNGNMNTLAFDRNGEKWTYEFKSDKVNQKPITRFLANTFYNPVVDITIEWNLLENYNLKDLKKELHKCVDNDDDILTQFVEYDFLKKEISKSNSFESILEKLDKYIFNVNEDELYKEKPE